MPGAQRPPTARLADEVLAFPTFLILGGEIISKMLLLKLAGPTVTSIHPSKGRSYAEQVANVYYPNPSLRLTQHSIFVAFEFSSHYVVKYHGFIVVSLITRRRQETVGT
ncbi:hypothetical protein NDU88_001434 [Pleurodeles waltl]|uniref:Uncharacterized protein n=1 Tax=Pleurodeles waltl TaxID=8319 RepID=A0AAV7KPJ9_PLEWA|nr:hypothetical protein NDU88_001434 [Pleurodeles waltl]